MSKKEVVNPSTYDLIIQMKESGNLHLLMQKGIIAIDWIDHINIYETYVKQRDKGESIRQSCLIAGVIHSVHFNTVNYIRKKMEV